MTDMSSHVLIQNEEQGNFVLVLRSLKQILPAQTLGFWDGKTVVAEEKF